MDGGEFGVGEERYGLNVEERSAAQGTGTSCVQWVVTADIWTMGRGAGVADTDVKVVWVILAVVLEVMERV